MAWHQKHYTMEIVGQLVTFLRESRNWIDDMDIISNHAPVFLDSLSFMLIAINLSNSCKH